MTDLKNITNDILLSHVEKLKKSNMMSVWRIKIDGIFITTPSKKSSWQKIGHAKNALRNALLSNIYRDIKIKLREYNIHDIPYNDIDLMIEETYQSFLTDHVEFVEICQDTKNNL